MTLWAVVSNCAQCLFWILQTGICPCQATFMQSGEHCTTMQETLSSQLTFSCCIAL